MSQFDAAARPMSDSFTAEARPRAVHPPPGPGRHQRQEHARCRLWRRAVAEARTSRSKTAPTTWSSTRSSGRPSRGVDVAHAAAGPRGVCDARSEPERQFVWTAMAGAPSSKPPFFSSPTAAGTRRPMTICTRWPRGLPRNGELPIVEACFLELAEPDIATGGSRCVARGATRVLMIPYFLSAGVHLLRDLTRAREELSRRHPGIEFRLGPPLGPHPLLDAWWPPGSVSSNAVRQPPWLSQVTRSPSVTLRWAIRDQGLTDGSFLNSRRTSRH